MWRVSGQQQMNEDHAVSWAVYRCEWWQLLCLGKFCLLALSFTCSRFRQSVMWFASLEHNSSVSVYYRAMIAQSI
jgi:hypothetical protein